VALYEWKASGRPISEFLRMDRNNDGFLTVEEVLWYEAQIAKNQPDKGQGSQAGRSGPGSFPSRPVRESPLTLPTRR
jgi:hypothetical protein